MSESEKLLEFIGQETPTIKVETNDDSAFNLMKFIAEKENKKIPQDEIREYYLNLYAECYDVVYDSEESSDE